MNADGPTWDALRQRVSGGGFSPAGAEALGQAISTLERLLGAGWPRRQYERCGWWPGELNLLGFHAAALPQFLALVTRLEMAAEVPSFGVVLRVIKRGVTTDGWRHALLQIEVARALRGSDTTITFEPEISGSTNRGDLLVVKSDGSQFLVETTTLGRGQDDLDREDHEHRVWQAIAALELRHGVRIAVQMGDHVDDTETRAWLNAIEDAIRSSGGSDAEVVESTVGRAEIRPAGSSVPEPAFVGARVRRDGWYRLGRVVHAKARQSAGSLPVWLRIDALDGFFQFTEWPVLDWPERIKRVTNALRHDLADAGAEHVAGVVLSSSSAVALGSTSPAGEDETVRIEQGTGMRRVLADHVVRETAVIPLRDDAKTEQAKWAAAYSTEPDWLRADLDSRSFPKLETISPTVASMQ